MSEHRNSSPLIYQPVETVTLKPPKINIMNKIRNFTDQKMRALTTRNVLKYFASYFSIVNWIRCYKWKDYLKHDILCGITLGVMQIPQSLAHARLSLLSPVTGLYVSLITPLLYMITGTSKLISIGPFSVIALMVGDVLSSGKPESYIQKYSLNQTGQGGIITIDEANVVIATTLTFLVGLIQVVLAIFHVGFISNFFSSTVTSAFIFGSACLVFTSQFQYLIGVKYLTTTGKTFSRFFNTYIDVFSNIKSINIVEISISAASIVLSIVLKYIGGFIEKRTTITLPSELIVIILFGGISYGAKLNEQFNIRIVGIVPSGLPKVTLPDHRIFSSLVFDAMVIALVGYACTVSLARGLAEKSSDKISYNKELFSYGFCNTISSFFSCFVCAGSLSRSAIAAKIGRTQLSAIVSSTIILIVLLVAAPLITPLPLATLSAIIVIALINVFKRVSELKTISEISLFETILWIVTSLGTIIFGITYGLLIGSSISVMKIIFGLLKPKFEILDEADQSNIQKNTCGLQNLKEETNIVVFKFKGSIIYLNKLFFAQKLTKIFARLKEMGSNERHFIILDGKYFNQIDMEGCQTLKNLIITSEKLNIGIYFSNLSEESNKTISFYFSKCKIDVDIFQTTNEAIIQAKMNPRNENYEIVEIHQN